MFTWKFLEDVKRKALRRGLWYGVLDRVERGILFLASRVVDVVRSRTLGVLIVKMLKKLKDAAKSGFVRHMESYGLERARKIAEQAVMLGHKEAVSWASDFGFVRYLTFMSFNKPSGWGIPNQMY